MAEGIDVELTKFADNSPIMELLLSRPLGILSQLDEGSRGEGDDSMLDGTLALSNLFLGK